MTQHTGTFDAAIRHAREENQRLTAHIDELTKALRVYANRDNWRDTNESMMKCWFEGRHGDDGWTLAEAVLAQIDGTPGVTTTTDTDGPHDAD